MQRTHSIVFSIVLLVLTFTATFAAITPVAKAYDYNYRYASNLYTTNWLQYSNEASATSTAFSQIANLFAQKTYYYYGSANGPSYGEVQNWGSSETPTTVYNQIDHDNAYHNGFSTVLYVGHGGPQGFYGYSTDPNNPNNLPPLISFSTISSHTQSSPAHHFVFMWVCMGGDSSPQGSPSAWNPLYWSNPSVYGPYTWIGFDSASPWLIDQMSPGNTNQNWLVFFYYYALTNGNSVMSALNYASVATGFSSYAASTLGSGNYQTYWPYSNPPMWASGRMHVAGNPSGTYLPANVYYP